MNQTREEKESQKTKIAAQFAKQKLLPNMIMLMLPELEFGDGVMVVL